MIIRLKNTGYILTLLFYIMIGGFASCSSHKTTKIYTKLSSGCDKQQTLDIISRRIQSLHPKNTAKLLDSDRIQIQLYLPANTVFLTQLLNICGKVYIAETYESSDIHPILLQVEDILLNRQDTNNVHNDLQKEHPLFHMLIPKMPSGSLMQEPVVGLAKSNDTATITNLLTQEDLKKPFPSDIVFLWTAEQLTNREALFELVAVKSSTQLKISPETINKSINEFNDQGFSQISIDFKKQFHTQWAQITRKNIGKALAIVSDNKVLTYPFVRSEITGGKVSISGNYTPEKIKLSQPLSMEENFFVSFNWNPGIKINVQRLISNSGLITNAI